MPANSLNWKPRKTLQSGGFASWLDRENASGFDQAHGPEFVIMHYHNDQYGTHLSTYDDRMFLNDEPLSTLAIFENYHVVAKENNLLLLRKTKHRPYHVKKNRPSADPLE